MVPLPTSLKFCADGPILSIGQVVLNMVAQLMLELLVDSRTMQAEFRECKSSGVQGSVDVNRHVVGV